MTGRHAGAVNLGEQAMLEQIRACHTEICEFMAARAVAPLSWDQATAARDALEALILAEQIMHRAAAAFTFVEAQAGL